jgi:hypothetical protein
MSGGPLRAVLAAVDGGALTALEIRRETGLSEEMVGAALDQLQRLGMLTAEQVAVGCPPDGCGGCTLTATCQPRLIGLSRTRG